MKERIEKAIFEGLEESYEDNYSFTGEISSIVKPESLIHINIAKKIRVINDENKNWGKPLKIKLEESTFRFATSCVPFNADPNDIFSSDYRENHNSTRSGNIDIALYVDGDSLFDDKPYAAIEIKDFITTRGELRQDIIRNMEFLTLRDRATGNSRLDLAYLACIHEHKGAIKKDDKQNEIDRLEAGYKRYMEKFDLASKGIQLRLEIKTVAEYLIGNDDMYLPVEILEDKAAEAIHFIGALIVLEKIN
jgi:hypothetical protein